MARSTIKSTYSLDVETVQTLERVARHWMVPKSEALRRAIRAAGDAANLGNDPVQALDELQESLNLNQATTTKWAESVRTDRRAASVRRDTRDH